MSKARSFTITETTASDMARAFLRFQFRQPVVVVTYALMLIFSIYVGFAFHSLFYAVGYAVLAFVLLPWSRYKKLQQRFKIAFPVGSKITATLNTTELVLGMPQASSKIAYDVFRSAAEQGEFIVLRQRASKICVILPRPLFPGDDLEQLRSKLAPTK